MDGYPLADPPAEERAAPRADRRPTDREAVAEGYALADPERPTAPDFPHHARPVTMWWAWLRALLLVGILVVHGLLCLACFGGWSQVASQWPLAWHDHPMHYHNALITRSFLVQNGTTAGYDPYFMSGYAKSLVSDPSGTLIDVVVAAFGRDHPAMTYKLLVLAIMASLPLLIALTIRLAGGTFEAVFAGTTAFVLYLWTDFPMEYAGIGMTAFLLVVPLGLVVLALFVRYFQRGGLVSWMLSALGASALLLVHPLSALTAGPAIVAVYLTAIVLGRRAGERLPISRHLGLLLIPGIMLALNAFWWLPGLTLAGTRDPDGADFFSHPEPVLSRIAQIFGLSTPAQPPIQILLLGGALMGLSALRHRCRLQAVGLGVFLASGVFWGYFAGWFQVFDFLQPGRNTYAAYSAGAVASGLAWAAVRRQLSRSVMRLDRWLTVLAVLVSVRLFLPTIIATIEYRTGRDVVPQLTWEAAELPRLSWWTPAGQGPFLSSDPTPEMAWLLEQIQTHFEPGDRLFYEEGGEQRGELLDPFGGHRYGGLLPSLARVEVIGGPFLRVPVRENFSQFGMGQLAGLEEWVREDFERYARLYRPDGIVCWSEKVRAFCRSNPDLIEPVAERGQWLVAKVRGFGGHAIRGEARVEAVAGRLRVDPIAPDVDGMIVLRYHSVPGLRSDPPGLLREVEEPGDPVPFIGVLRPDGALTIEWKAPP